MRIASLTILCLALAAVPAFGQWSYNNGPINGTTDAWTINFGYVVSDTFTLSAASTTSTISFGVWEFPGDLLSTVDYTVSATENGAGVGATANVSDKFISSNQYGYDIDQITFTSGSFALPAGTYWLNLYNATVPSGDPVYWDENSGPSSASESSVGTIPSEAFTVNSAPLGCGVGNNSPECTPEPGSILLFGSGILGLVSVLRGKLHL